MVSLSLKTPSVVVEALMNCTWWVTHVLFTQHKTTNKNELVFIFMCLNVLVGWFCCIMIFFNFVNKKIRYNPTIQINMQLVVPFWDLEWR